MSSKMNVYLHFGGNCREAMNFYRDCLGGELNIQTVGESPMAGEMPEEMQSQVMHASLHRNGELLLMASDMLGKTETVQGNSISLSLECNSEEQLREWYEKLSKGGKITNELQEQFWGALFASFNDKFGMPWMLDYELKQKQ